MSRQSLTMGLLVSGLVVLAAVLGVFTAMDRRQQEAQPAIPGLLWPQPKTLGPFTAVDHEKKPVHAGRPARQSGRCCSSVSRTAPTSARSRWRVMDKVHEQVARGRDVQSVFVSVDPERDTPQRMEQYLASFNPEFIGLGGSAEQVAGLTGQVGLAYFRDETEDGENYLIDHGGSLFMIDPRGRLVGIFSPAP